MSARAVADRRDFILAPASMSIFAWSKVVNAALSPPGKGSAAKRPRESSGKGIARAAGFEQNAFRCGRFDRVALL
jgi:hypothetical protein